jgi:phosphomannomutase
VIDAAMATLRQHPPVSLGGMQVTSAEDLSDGAGDLPPTDGLRYRLAEGGRVVVRPSGTEPKIKCYLEVVVPVGRDGDVGAARRTAADALHAIKRDVAAAAGLPSPPG